jgi:hypothetical protein
MLPEFDIFSGFSLALRSTFINLNDRRNTSNGLLFLRVSLFFLFESLFGFLAFGLIFLQELAKSSELILQVFVLVFDLVLSELELCLLTE